MADQRNHSQQEPTSAVAESELSQNRYPFQNSSTSPPLNPIEDQVQSLSPSSSPSSSSSGLPLSPPPHIMKRLTPLKRKDQSKNPDNNIGTSKKKVSNKPRTLSASEVQDKVIQLRVERRIKEEKKRLEIEDKLKAALKNRELIINKKRESATKFIENSKIWDSFQDTFEDFDKENGDAAANNRNDQNEAELSPFLDIHNKKPLLNHPVNSSSEAASIEQSSEENRATSHKAFKKLQAARVIRRSIIRFLCKKHAEFFKGIDIFSKYHKTHHVLKKSYASKKKFFQKVIFNDDLIHKFKFIFHFGLGIQDPNKLQPHMTVLISLKILYDYIFKTDECSLKLGGKALELYRGFRLPNFEKDFYYHDKFSIYIGRRLIMKASSLIKAFKNLIHSTNWQNKIDLERLRFFKTLSSFQEIILIHSDDNDKRLLLLMMKVNNTLNRALGIQIHIENNNVFNVSGNIELDSRVNNLRVTLEKQKAENNKRMNFIKDAMRKKGLIYNSPSSYHFTKGITLSNRRRQLFGLFTYEEKIKDRVLVPPGFTIDQWRRYMVLKCYDGYDANFNNSVVNNTGTGAPKRMSTGIISDLSLLVNNRIIVNDTLMIHEVERIYKLFGIETHSQIADRQRAHLEVGNKGNTQNTLKKMMKMTQDLVKFLDQDLEGRPGSKKFKESHPNLFLKHKFLIDFKISTKQKIKEDDVELFFRSMIELLAVYIEGYEFWMVTAQVNSVAKMLDNVVDHDVDKTSYKSRLLEYVQFWELLMELFSTMLIKKSFLHMKYNGYKSTELELFQYSSIIKSTQNKWVLDESLKVFLLDIAKVNSEFTNRYFESRTVFEEVLIRNRGNSQLNNYDSIQSSSFKLKVDIIKYVMSKIFSYIYVGDFSEQKRIGFSDNFCAIKPDLNFFIDEYKKILQMMFINFIIETVLNKAPLIFTGNEQPGVFNALYKTRSILKPNMNEFGTDLYKKLYLELNHPKLPNSNFKLEESVVDFILEILLKHVIAKVRTDSRFSNLYAAGSNFEANIVEFATKNITGSLSLKQLLMEHCRYFEKLGKNLNTSVFICIMNYFQMMKTLDKRRWNATLYRETIKNNSNLLKEKFRGLNVEYIEKLVYELIRMFNVHLYVYTPTYEKLLKGEYLHEGWGDGPLQW